MALRQCFLRPPELTKIVLPKVLQNFQKTPKCTGWTKELNQKGFPSSIQNTGRDQRVHFFRHCATFFKKKFFPHESPPPSIFWSFATEWMLKNPKGSTLSVFSALWDFSKKNFHKRVPNSPILGNFEVLLLFLSLGYCAELGRSRLVLFYSFIKHLNNLGCWHFVGSGSR